MSTSLTHTENLRAERESLEESLRLLEQKHKEERDPYLHQLHLIQKQCGLLGHPNSTEDQTQSLPSFKCEDCGKEWNL